jgi:hypothetical protein
LTICDLHENHKMSNPTNDKMCNRANATVQVPKMLTMNSIILIISSGTLEIYVCICFGYYFKNIIYMWPMILYGYLF